MNINSKSVSYRLILKQFAIQVTLLVCTVIILFTFQNCSDPMVEGDLESLSEAAPFAYDAKLDHIAYMSCASATNNPSYFTFKGGAYDAGSGINLRSDFLSATSSLSSASKAAVLAQSPLNMNVSMQAAVRYSANYQQTYGNGIFGSFGQNLSASANANVLANLAPGARANSLSGSAPQGQVSYVTYDETQQQLVRDFVGASGAGFIGFTFLQPGGDAAYAAAPVVNSTSQVYGSAFKAAFRTPPGYSTSSPARALAAVGERLLESNTDVTTAVWNCSDSFVFKIVDDKDRGSQTYCNAGPGYTGDYGTTGLSAADQLAYQTIRKVLPESLWGIDMTNHCVVPKTADISCYPASVVRANIAYNAAAACGGTTGKTCAAFVSVCKRQ